MEWQKKLIQYASFKLSGDNLQRHKSMMKAARKKVTVHTSSRKANRVDIWNAARG
jgi:hypothetical protein